MMNWLKPLRGRVKKREPLKKHTTFRIGGRADFFVIPKDETDLKLLLKLLKRGKMPYLLIGCGSNLLVADEGVRRAVISLDSPSFREIVRRGNFLEAGGGARLGGLISASRKYGLSGLEFLAGIPGSLGGALVMNAGISERVSSGKARQRSISDRVYRVRVMDKSGKVRELKKNQIAFGYRSSSLGKYIVLSASFKLDRLTAGRVLGNIKRYLIPRRQAQDWCAFSAGCVFKNPKGKSAGRLIDSCGLKGERSGGAVVSRRHANFILNADNASSADVIKLMRLIKRRVKAKFGISLEPEIKIWQN